MSPTRRYHVPAYGDAAFYEPVLFAHVESLRFAPSAAPVCVVTTVLVRCDSSQWVPPVGSTTCMNWRPDAWNRVVEPMMAASGPFCAHFRVTADDLGALEEAGDDAVRCASERAAVNAEECVAIVLYTDSDGAAYVLDRGAERGVGDEDAVWRDLAARTARALPGVADEGWVEKEYGKRVVEIYGRAEGYTWGKAGTVIGAVDGGWLGSAGRVLAAWGNETGKKESWIREGRQALWSRWQDRAATKKGTAVSKGMSPGVAERRFGGMMPEVPLNLVPLKLHRAALECRSAAERRGEWDGVCGKCPLCNEECASVSELWTPGVDAQAMRCMYMKVLWHLWYGAEVFLSRAGGSNPKCPSGFIRDMPSCLTVSGDVLRQHVDLNLPMRTREASEGDGGAWMCMRLNPYGNVVSNQMGWARTCYLVCLDFDVNKSDPMDGFLGPCDSVLGLTNAALAGADAVEASVSGGMREDVQRIYRYGYRTSSGGVHVYMVAGKPVSEFPPDGQVPSSDDGRRKATRWVGSRDDNKSVDVLPEGNVVFYKGRGKEERSGLTDDRGKRLHIEAPYGGGPSLGTRLLKAAFCACTLNGTAPRAGLPLYLSGMGLEAHADGEEEDPGCLKVQLSGPRKEDGSSHVMARSLSDAGSKIEYRQSQGKPGQYRTMNNVPRKCMRDLCRAYACRELFAEAASELAGSGRETYTQESASVMESAFGEPLETAIGVCFGYPMWRQCLASAGGEYGAEWARKLLLPLHTVAHHVPVASERWKYCTVLDLDIDVRNRLLHQGHLSRADVAACVHSMVPHGAVAALRSMLSGTNKCDLFRLEGGSLAPGSQNAPVSIKLKSVVRARCWARLRRTTNREVYVHGLHVNVEFRVDGHLVWISKSTMRELKKRIWGESLTKGQGIAKERARALYGRDERGMARWMSSIDRFVARYPVEDRTAPNVMNMEFGKSDAYELAWDEGGVICREHACPQWRVDDAMAFASAIDRGSDRALTGADASVEGVALCDAEGVPAPPAARHEGGASLGDRAATLLRRVNTCELNEFEFRCGLHAMCAERTQRGDLTRMFYSSRDVVGARARTTWGSMFKGFMGGIGRPPVGKLGKRRASLFDPAHVDTTTPYCVKLCTMTGQPSTAVVELKFKRQPGEMCGIKGGHHGKDSGTKTFVWAHLVVAMRGDEPAEVVSGRACYFCSADGCTCIKSGWDESRYTVIRIPQVPKKDTPEPTGEETKKRPRKNTERAPKRASRAPKKPKNSNATSRS